MNEESFVPVYLFTGFLEAGKTQFIQQTLKDERFNNGDRTLLLVCEEGIEEYDTTDFEKDHVFLRTIEDKNDLNPAALGRFLDETKAVRVIVEYNGMWTMNDLLDALPDDWAIYQIMNFADATTFLNFNQNMRSLVVDKLQNCELTVFNRFDKATMDQMEFHKIVRGVSRRTEIAYEYTDGTSAYDDIEDPLPFDINADNIVVEDRDYALWYRDITEEPEKYDGKKVTLKAMAATNPQFPKGTIGLGRQIMTCCIEDITFCWLASLYDKPLPMSDKPKWVDTTFTVRYQRHKLYRGKGPVLVVESLKDSTPPEKVVATFY
ncbi:MAG: GTPase [Ruminococcus sp.]|nr:GTPase [Ruminococcus sp.]